MLIHIILGLGVYRYINIYLYIFLTTIYNNCFLFIKSIEAIGPGRAGVFVNLVPVFTAILAVVILGESFMLLHIVALGLVLGGILLSEWAKLH